MPPISFVLFCFCLRETTTAPPPSTNKYESSCCCWFIILFSSLLFSCLVSISFSCTTTALDPSLNSHCRFSLIGEHLPLSQFYSVHFFFFLILIFNFVSLIFSLAMERAFLCLRFPISITRC